MQEKDLTAKQREWLDASKKIGLGPMTKSERLTLERLYAEMLPAEQQQLAAYIEENFGYEIDEAPILEQQEKDYRGPSDGLRSALAGALSARPPSDESDK